jgi:O-acetyl-ADP-ribose deacetylase (regulator of RNase III)
MTIVASFFLLGKWNLCVARGSVVDFVSPISGAIVNAANEQCLGGGGVDGAITAAGGIHLARDRLALPCHGGDIRCPTGSAVITGPGNYGSLQVPYVVHAVGPNYYLFDDFHVPDQLLRSAYTSSLDRCHEDGITDVAFALLSAGVFRGRREVKDVLRVGVTAIRDWSVSAPSSCQLKSIVLYGFSEQETSLLLKICEAEIAKS